ncbi:MAG: hypothetical protein JKY65_24020 [Planctomycetes bacterium]|nr:hypothetical protein [Planctomycetota bacterium]
MGSAVYALQQPRRLVLDGPAGAPGRFEFSQVLIAHPGSMLERRWRETGSVADEAA